MRGKGIWTLALVLILLVCLVPANAFAAVQPGLSSGTEVLAAGVNTTSAATVYYGGKTWCVVGYDGEGGTSSTGSLGKTGNMTLLYSGNVAATHYDDNEDDGYSNEYATSNLRNKVDGIAGEFADGEKEAVTVRTLAGHSANYGENGYEEDKISGKDVTVLLWPLSVAEANLLDEELRKADPEPSYTQYSFDRYWWLRTPGYGVNFTAYVDGDGNVKVNGYHIYNLSIGVRPAFYVNLESVLFTSAALDGKSSGAVGADALALVSTSANQEWKLTLLDETHAGFQIKSGDITYNSQTGVVTVPYTGVTATGGNEYISALIKDGSGAIKYYGRVAKASSAADASVTINTSGKLGTSDKLYVFSEQYNGDKKTDYASPLQEVSLLSHEHTYKTVTTKATLSANGKKETKCSVCGDVKEKTVIYYPKTFKLAKTSYTYDGKEKKPALSVTDANGKTIAASNYSLVYANNQNAGTATVTITFKENYTGTKKLNFTINPAKVDLPTAKTGLTYNGAKQTGVAAGTNYTVTSGAGTEAKTYTAKATLKDTKNYTWSDGTKDAKSIKWTIGAANLKNATIAAIKNQSFTGSALKPAPVVKMTLNGKSVTLKAGSDYKVTYKNNTNPGTATVTVAGLLPNFTGSKSATFKIVKTKAEFLRLSGADRYATSLAIADEYKKVLGVKQFDTICVADGVNYPDALAGAYFAYMNKAPIVDIHQKAPTGPQSTNAINYIKKNLKKGGKVYILGGPGSVPDSIASTLMNSGFQVIRIWGANRYTSNLEILKASNIKAGTDFVVATGADFADALTASATGKPVLLVVGNALTADQKAYLKTAGAKSFTIVGSTKEVSAAIEKELKTYAPTTRLGAASAYDRSIAVAKKYFTGTQLHINLADGRNFPDALCGGPLAAKKGGPLFLTDGTEAVNKKTQDYAKAANTMLATVYGGPASISDATCKYILSMK